jgi:hypothetical protein
MMHDDRSRPWHSALPRRALLAFAVLTSVVVAAVLGYAVFLLAWGFSHDDPMAIPYFYLVVIVAGAPAALVCGVAWAGYIAAARMKPSRAAVPCQVKHPADGPHAAWQVDCDQPCQLSSSYCSPPSYGTGGAF